MSYSESDSGLGAHFDNAEMTLNVCLSEPDEDFIGGEVVFEDARSGRIVLGVEHQLGFGILHRGSAIHRALPLEKTPKGNSNRTNLILWIRSSDVRKQKCPRCKSEPRLEQVAEGYGDGFIFQE